MKNKKLTRDLILLAVILLLAGGALLVMKLTAHKGAVVEVSVSGEVIATYALDHDMETDIDGAYGGCNHLVIKDGEAWLSSADCPDKLCVYMGHVFQDGEAIICLPNEVVVYVIDEDNVNGEKAVDVVSGGH